MIAIKFTTTYTKKVSYYREPTTTTLCLSLNWKINWHTFWGSLEKIHEMINCEINWRFYICICSARDQYFIVTENASIRRAVARIQPGSEREFSEVGNIITKAFRNLSNNLFWKQRASHSNSDFSLEQKANKSSYHTAKRVKKEKQFQLFHFSIVSRGNLHSNFFWHIQSRIFHSHIKTDLFHRSLPFVF